MKKTGRFDYIDLLRVIALGSVIIFHYFFNGIAKKTITSIEFTAFSSVIKYGYLGVPLFFMISGFVIQYSTYNRSFVDFWKKRILRLYPMYWMAIFFIYFFVSLDIWKLKTPNFVNVRTALTMFPTAFNGQWMDATHWFLIRELQFYLAMSFFLALGLSKQLPKVFPIWALFICIWNLFNFPQYDVWYLNGYFALMTGGAIIYSIREWGFNKLQVLGLIASYVCAIDSQSSKVAFLLVRRDSEYSALVIAAVITAIYVLMLFTLLPVSSRICSRWIVFAGAMTYPVFLIHGRIGAISIQKLASNENKYLSILLIFIAICLIAYCMLKLDKIISKPFGRFILKIR